MSEFIKIQFKLSNFPVEEEQVKLLNEICEKFVEQDEKPFNEGISTSKKTKKCEVYFEYGGYSTEEKLEEALIYLQCIGAEEVIVNSLNTQVGEEAYYAISNEKLVRAETKKELQELLKPVKHRIESEFYEKFGSSDTVLVKVRPKTKKSAEKLVALLKYLILEPRNPEYYKKFCDYMNAASDMTDIEYPSLIYIDDTRSDGPDYLIDGICFVDAYENDVFMGFTTPKGFVLINDGFEIILNIFALVFKRVAAKLRFTTRPSIERYFFLYDGEINEIQKDKQADDYWPR